MLKWLNANYQVLGKKIDYTNYLLHNSDNFTKILIFLKIFFKDVGFFWHNKGQEAGLNPTVTVHGRGVTPRVKVAWSFLE